MTCQGEGCLPVDLEEEAQCLVEGVCSPSGPILHRPCWPGDSGIRSGRTPTCSNRLGHRLLLGRLTELCLQTAGCPKQQAYQRLAWQQLTCFLCLLFSSSSSRSLPPRGRADPSSLAARRARRPPPSAWRSRSHPAEAAAASSVPLERRSARERPVSCLKPLPQRPQASAEGATASAVRSRWPPPSELSSSALSSVAGRVREKTRRRLPGPKTPRPRPVGPRSSACRHREQ